MSTNEFHSFWSCRHYCLLQQCRPRFSIRDWYRWLLSLCRLQQTNAQVQDRWSNRSIVNPRLRRFLGLYCSRNLWCGQGFYNHRKFKSTICPTHWSNSLRSLDNLLLLRLLFNPQEHQQIQSIIFLRNHWHRPPYACKHSWPIDPKVLCWQIAQAQERARGN